jgi:hypothetical protein
MTSADFCLCVATYRRPLHLSLLLGDVLAQHLRPGSVVIADGDPGSGEVAALLQSFSGDMALTYVPSSHASLPYQRCLAWQTSKDSRWLLYLDDDIRIKNPDFTREMLRPLEDGAAAVTCPIMFGDPARSGLTYQLAVNVLTARGPRLWHKLFNLGSTPPGGVSPTGHRRMPYCAGMGGTAVRDYAPVEWLSGGVMALRTEAVTRACFPDIAFALFQARRGTGEDLVIARHVRQSGPLVMALHTSADHPSEVPTNFGPQAYFPLGVTMALGERFVNDAFRGSAAPPWGDRLFLCRSLAGTLLLNLWRTLWQPSKMRLLYGAGFAWGGAAGALSISSLAGTCPRNLLGSRPRGRSATRPRRPEKGDSWDRHRVLTSPFCCRRWHLFAAVWKRPP